MELNDYQYQAVKKIKYKKDDWIYPAMGLAGEVGEVMNSLKEIHQEKKASNVTKTLLIHDLSDTLWYLAVIAHHFDVSLEDLAQINLEKPTPNFPHDNNLG